RAGGCTMRVSLVMWLHSSVSAAVLAVAVTYGAAAAEPPRAAAILAERCMRCHNPTVHMSGLSLATSAEIRKGGQHGPAVVPGNPEKSLLLQMVSGDKPRMPMG